MKKKIAHYPLADVQAFVKNGCVRATKTALDGAALLGFSFPDMKEAIENLEPADFHKSMTSHHDHKIWQDVYRYPAQEVDIYLKIQIVGEVVIVSFKEF